MEIKAWQEGRALAKAVYKQTKVGPMSKDFGFKDQIQRAVVSINSNIAEGFERDSTLEFVKFIGYAKGSAGEVLSQLITASDIGYIGQEDFVILSERAKFIGVLLSRLRSAILSNEQSGLRWKTSPPQQPPTPKPSNPET